MERLFDKFGDTFAYKPIGKSGVVASSHGCFALGLMIIIRQID